MKITNTNYRSIGLDFVRSVAILLVVLYHIFSYFFKIKLSGFWYVAYMGVDIFFALSGFLIGKILYRILESYSWKIPTNVFFNFLIRRILRTLPLYYFMLVLNYFYSKFLHSNIEKFDLNFLILMQNFTKENNTFFGESWSLSVEEHFYFWLPLVYMFFSFFTHRIIRTKKITSDLFKKTLLILLLIFTIIRFVSPLSSYQQIRIVVYRLDSILIGVLVSIYSNEIFKENFRKKFLIFGAGVILIAVLLFLFKSVTGEFSKLYFPLSGLGFSLLVGYFEKWKINKKHPALFTNSVKYISKISYALYLVNLFVLFGFNEYLINDCMTSNVEKIILSTLLIFVFSHLIHKYIEEPFLKLREKYFPPI